MEEIRITTVTAPKNQWDFLIDTVSNLQKKIEELNAEDRWVSIDKACDILDVKRYKIKILIQSGDLIAAKIGDAGKSQTPVRILYRSISDYMMKMRIS